MNPLLVGIGGPSCSGKSELARRLATVLQAPVLAIDHYYRDLAHLPPEQRAAVNFDSPDALEAGLIFDHVMRLKRGLAVEQPTYDFTRHVRAEATEPIRPAAFVIVEGLFVLYWPALRELLDYRVYLAADHDVCLARRVARDVRERGRSEASVKSQYEATVRPMCDGHIAPTRRFAGIVLSGSDPVESSARRVIEHMGIAFDSIGAWPPAPSA